MTPFSDNFESEWTINPIDDRTYWVQLLSKMATPILENIAKQQLRENMPMELSPTYGTRATEVGYLEAFGRLIAGIAPWLALPDDNTPEGKIRKEFREQALLGIQYGVTPESPDYFAWNTNAAQTLVDAAFLAQGLLRAPKALWEPLSENTKLQVVSEFKKVRKIRVNENNWLLFSAIVETFLYTIEEECMRDRIDYAVNKFDQDWYVGDGWYSDGPRFSFDHYNGYVIHCMQAECLLHNISAGEHYKVMYDRAYKRMQRYGHHQERMIAPDGTYVVVGRSSTYRNAAFQPLAALALDDRLPEQLSKGQVRSALTAMKRKIFMNNSFNESGWLTLGFVGNKQQDLADYYTNTGYLYMASLSFLPLGLPADDEFWICKPEKWTSQNAFAGEPFPKDYHVNY
jgi:hypothetical protein